MGALKITGQSAPPTVTASDAGMVYYDTTSNKLRHYNGTAWADVSPAIASTDLPVGSIIQTKVIRYDDPITLSSDQPGGALTGLKLTITPESADSVLWMQWIIHGEAGHDASNWRVYKNGGAIETAGYEGQSNYGSLNTWDVLGSNYTGVGAGSTPSTQQISYYIKSGSTSSQYYELVSWHSSGSDTVYINRTQYSEAGLASYEHGVSFGIIQEIADGSSTSVVL